jgi:hypothetical protein
MAGLVLTTSCVLPRPWFLSSAAGHLTLQERLEAGQGCLDAVRRSLHHVMDDVNMSTFMHRISRLLSHPAMAPVRSYLDLREVVPVGICTGTAPVAATR